MKDGFVYIMASLTRTLYIGVTNSLTTRVSQHQNGEIPGFTKRYQISRLVYFEHYDDIRDAIAREKQLKGWRRFKKNALNPDWKDLTDSLFEEEPVGLTMPAKPLPPDSSVRDRTGIAQNDG